MDADYRHCKWASHIRHLYVRYEIQETDTRLVI